MIFLVVGTQEPFDRLVSAMDEWAATSGYTDIFGQIADSSYLPKNFSYARFMDPETFNEKFKTASLIVAHAGMGTILQALQLAKPIVVLPRLYKYHETRNDHQVSTAKSLEKLGFVHAVYSGEELIETLNKRDTLQTAPPIGPAASETLLMFIQDFLNSCKK
ncbi:MAG: glycosyltransferase [Lentimicrobiaceae bacterium]|nr:glycosyltransferase [Lentimicrobiaceae bacterium]